MSQINGGKKGAKNTTTARFPNMLNNQKMLIAASALRQANDNYNRKFNKAVSDATKDASADIAQYMCQKMADGGGTGVFSGPGNGADTPLAPPYSISYEIGSGLTTAQLMQGGKSITGDLGSAGTKHAGNKVSDVIDALTVLGGKAQTASARGGVQRTAFAIFTRETRNCHICTSTVISSCSSSGGTRGFLGIGAKAATSDCKLSEPKENCEDIPM